MVLSGKEIKRSPLPFSLASSSIFTPSASLISEHISFLAYAEFSPIPAVKQIASAPPRAI